MLRAVLLDLYGTLIDSAEYRSPYSYLIMGAGLERDSIEEVRLQLMTHELPTVRDAALFIEHRFATRPIPESEIRHAEEELRRHVLTFEAVERLEEVMDELRRRDLQRVLVTNLSTPYEEPIARLGIDRLIDHAIHSCAVGYAKPDPRIFRLALARAGVRPDEAVMVGDNPHDDIEGAQAAGIRGLLIGADGDLPALSALPDVLRTIGG